MSDGWSLYIDNTGGANNTYGLDFKINGATTAPDFILSEVQAIPLNRWIQVAVTCQSGTLKIWVNGGITAQQAGVSAIIASASPIIIGRSSTAADRYFSGMIDEVAIWNRALSQTEIEALYNRQKGDYGNNLENSYTSAPIDSGVRLKSWSTFSPTPLAPYSKQIVASPGETSAYSLGGIDVTGLVGYWNLNGAAGPIANGTVFTDLSGNGNNGTAASSGSIMQRVSGKLSDGVYFDGNDTVVIPSSPSLKLGAYMTLTGWVRPAAFQAGWHAIAGKGLYDYWLEIGSSYGGYMRPCMGRNSNPTDYEVLSDVPIPINRWSFVAGTYDGTTTKIYVNGVMTNSRVVGGPIQVSDDPFAIGSADSTEFLNGSVDEVSVWNRALDASEIMALYQRGAMQLKYQVRSCATYNCSDAAFVGPDQTTNTFFSDFTNTSSGLPVFDISAIVSPNRYIQYKAFFESDDSLYSPKLMNGAFH
ncbi:MAG: LamG domain-containing protein [Bdellovibrionales bacterium]|nr:LamG domain-containing protein [Bdellovibrionales bacterium]